jgi:CRISPR/Cas system-associated protein endoribonuclease Cas2
VKKKLVLVRKAKLFNPFFVGEYELKNIYFFDEKGVKIEVGRGWFGNNNRNRIDMLETDLNYVRKRKIDFSLKHAFIVSVKREYWIKKGKFAYLYMPYEAFEWEIKKEHESTSYTRKKYIYDLYINKTLSVKTRILNRIEPIQENINYLEKISPLAKLITGKKVSENEFYLMKNKKEIIEFLGW